MKSYDILIIGAGSVGTPLSYYLAEKGMKVGVIEQNASTGRGQNRAAIGGLRATFSDPAKIKICAVSINEISHMKENHGIDVDWVEGGYIYPIFNEAQEKSLKNLLTLQKSFGLDIDWVSAEEVKERVPGIQSEGLRGGTFSPHDGSASPIKTTGAFYRLARGKNVEFHFNEKVLSMEVSGGKINSVKTDRDSYSADLIINAAGPFSREIGDMCGVKIPVSPECHEAGITEPVEYFLRPMVVDIRPDDISLNYYFYQNYEGQFVFCITPKPPISGTDIDNTSSFMPQMVERMLALYPRLRNLRIRRTWRGLYPMTPDGFPIVGRTKEISNLFLATGMCGQGYMIGSGLGKILSEIIVNDSHDYDFILEQLTLYRDFSGDEMLK
ncbi:FAD-binding oxidoreductase [bacterium]|nr:FAD-binding oxidoreductase [bacterium]